MKKKLTFIFLRTIGCYLNVLSYFFPKKTATIAYNLFSKPRKGKLDVSKLPAVLQKANRKNLEGLETYIWHGGQKKILLAHGWESNSSRWNKLIKELKKNNYTIIALDAPAHGLSIGTDFNAIKYANCMANVIQLYKPQYVIGHSVGAMATIYNQFKNPNSSIEKIVCLGAPSDFRLIFNSYTNMLGYNKIVVAALDQYYLENFNLKIDDFSCAVFAKSITVAGLIVHDRTDKIIPISESKKIHTNWQNSLCFETTGLGHSLQNKALFEKIIIFLNG
jgi:pimeloyl-ACP methyl ester carboxylesterase